MSCDRRGNLQPRLMKLTLALAGLAFAVLAFADVGTALADDARPPNILFAFADDWGYPHAGVYGDATIEAPTFDRVASEGVLFVHAFISSPSCTPARGAVLAGQDFWRLGDAANLWSLFPEHVPVYPDLVGEQGGYFVGHTRKGWGPGRIGDREHNPAGPGFPSFEQFLEQRPDDQPFCFWFGSRDPHRSIRRDGAALREAKGIDPDDVIVPPMLPDAAAVREDIADYYAQAQRFDREVGELLRLLEERGELDNTLVVISSDHGWPFPRGKANLYDTGTRVPLAIRWPDRVREPGRTLTDFVNINDLAPTFLEAAGVDVPEQMTGRSLMPLLTSDAEGRADSSRDHVFAGRERHTPAQAEGNSGGYPMRSIRTDRFLYIRNYKPDRWPVGTPAPKNAHIAGAWLGDTDNGQAKFYMWANRDAPAVRPLYDLAFAKRPAEELYDIEDDPHQLRNVAEDPVYADTRRELANRLTQYLRETDDPRELEVDPEMDKVEYFGGVPRWPGQEVIDRFREAR